MMLRLLFTLLGASLVSQAATLTTKGRCFLLDGEHFPYTGVSFFNAIHNKAFNQARADWLRKFKKYGVNTLRLWAQWDNKRGFVDVCPTCTLYQADGSLSKEHVDRLKEILKAADAEKMVVELALFSQESWHDGIKLGREASLKAVQALTEELKPHRNLTLQIWNEFDENAFEYAQAIKKLDPARLVSNSPGVAGVILAPANEMRILDYYSPHTTRQKAGRPWLVGPAELAMLLTRFNKPVVDDEPARNGTSQFGGPKEQTYPHDHILQIWEDWKLGVYPTYHHDMFQTGAGSKAVPPTGIPDPEFNPYHRAVFEFLALRDRYAPRPVCAE